MSVWVGVMEKVMGKSDPIFVRGFSRSGSTLFVTMLDAHPDIAMSYEIYERYLSNEQGQYISVQQAIDLIDKAVCDDGANWVRGIERAGLKRFVACSRRSGIEVKEFASELRFFCEDGGSFAELEGRLSFVERLMILKMKKNGKTFWGGKAGASLEQLLKLYPRGVFLKLIRDGRDVLASQLKLGSFNTTAQKCAKDWRASIMEFKEMMNRKDARIRFVKYEDLASEPEEILKDVCGFIGVEYSGDMLSFHERAMSLFVNPHGQLSHKQIAKGVNTSSIGRWKADLSSEDLDIFVNYNSDILMEYGYEV